MKVTFLPVCAFFTQVIDFWHAPLPAITGNRIPLVIINETETSDRENTKSATVDWKKKGVENG